MPVFPPQDVGSLPPRTQKALFLTKGGLSGATAMSAYWADPALGKGGPQRRADYSLPHCLSPTSEEQSTRKTGVTNQGVMSCRAVES